MDEEDVIIEELVIEEDRVEHIAKHGVTINEVLEITGGDYVHIKGKLERWLLIGKTGKGRFLTVIVGTRLKKNVFGLVTTRPAKKVEISFYMEYTTQKGGAKDD